MTTGKKSIIKVIGGIMKMDTQILRTVTKMKEEVGMRKKRTPNIF